MSGANEDYLGVRVVRRWGYVGALVPLPKESPSALLAAHVLVHFMKDQLECLPQIGYGREALST